MTTLNIIMRILPYVLCAGIPSFFFIRNNINKNREHDKEVQDLKRLNIKLVETEKAKGVVRDEFNKKENAIASDPVDAPSVLPVSTKREHNHSFRDPCSKGCPAYSGD